MKLFFATSNRNKVLEANEVGKDFEVFFEMLKLDYPEVRSDDVAEVAGTGVEYVHKKVGGAVIVEDSGIFIDALNGFPGAYSAMAFKKIGLEGILKLMAGVEERGCRFKSAVGYADENGIRIFEGEVEGVISMEVRGSAGFGYDPIFVPEGYDKTFGEIPDVKKKLSHRRVSVEKLCRAVGEV
ncbi:MAG TPA: XTP/dITP diphosphatase [Candidatus Altiarchaeales archaeon]|nr:XTP/dITP diphosphatase [Candidatus Altiarchaeales archaeon]